MKSPVATAAGAFLLLVALLGATSAAASGKSVTKQQSLDEWRSLTASTARPPRVYVKGDQVRFFFPTGNGVEEFSAHWGRVRVPAKGYELSSALLRWDRKLPRMGEGERGWREATVIAGAEWRKLATNLLNELAPKTNGHALYYQVFLADGVLYRDAQGAPRFAALGEQPGNVKIDHHFSADETLQTVGHKVEEHLAQTHPGDSLFVMMAPNGKKFTQPLLVDRQQHQCVYLTPAALYDTTERGVTLTVTAQGFSALLLEGHGIALLKNPFSSLARLGDLGVATLVRFMRLPLPHATGEVRPVIVREGMDLEQWEHWLDTYTGTRPEDGSLRLLIDGDRFFPRLQQAIAQATNHIHFNLYIFDRDDVAVGIADQLKQRSSNVEVKVVMDRLGSLASGIAPPGTPMPEDFVPPASIASYLAKDSQVQVRAFLNPWFSSDHSKVLLVDGLYGWLGGMNIGREYRYEWHDLMVEVGGPVIASLEDQFRHNWAHAGTWGDFGYAAALLSPTPQSAPPTGPGPWIKVRRLPTRTAWKPFSAAVFASLRKARSYVYVESPYLFDKRVITELVTARHRGVDVRVVLPRINDFKAGARSNVMIANYLIEHGVRVYFYPNMTHAKALLVDGWSCLGSGNLNHLSLRINQEDNIATSDPAVAAHVKHDLFDEDFAHSYELTTPLSVDWVDFLADLVIEGF